MPALCRHGVGAGKLCRLTELRNAVHLPPRRMRRAFGFLYSILLAPNPGDGGEGGGGAGGGGGGSNNPSGAGEPGNTGLTEERAQKLIDAAIKGRDQQLLKQIESKQTKAFDDLKTGLMSSFTELLTETLSKHDEEAGSNGKGKNAAPPTDVTQSQEFKKLQKQLDDQKRQLDESKAERERERLAKRESEFNRTVEAELAKQKALDPEAARLVLQGKKRIRQNEDDSIDFVDAKGDGASDLSEGIAGWLKSEGKHFMPASGASGSGERPRGGREGSNGASKSGSQGLSEAAVGESIAGHFGIPLS